MQTRITAAKKRCTECRKAQPMCEFWRDARQKTGSGSKCRTCRNDYMKAYRKRVAVQNRRARWASSATEKAKQVIRAISRRLYPKRQKCAVVSCASKKTHRHHLTNDPRTFVFLCSAHHELVHHG